MAIRRGALPCSLGSSPQGSSATISPVARSRSAARASDWSAPEWWTVAAAAEASPGLDPSGPSLRAEFQASRGVRCCNAGIPQLGAALAALGNSTGPEVVALQQALKARTDAEGMLSATQLKECQLFVERKEKKKIASIDQERAHEMKLLEEGRARLERLRKVEILQKRATDCATDSSKCFWRCPEVASNGGATSVGEGRVVEEEGQSAVARRFRVCVRRGSDPMAGRSPERYERRIDGGERWGSGQDGCSRE